jgi:hypothetical protein
VALTLVVDTSAAEAQLQANMALLGERMQGAISASLNMAASMIKDQGDADIAGAGRFGAEWTDGLHVDVSTAAGNMQISMYHDIPYAGIFEEGGQIEGQPLLWIGLSGTDAEGVRPRDYPGGLFAVNRRAGGPPLLFSTQDQTPKFFGVTSVTIPKKFHLAEIARNVMAGYKQLFVDAMPN